MTDLENQVPAPAAVLAGGQASSSSNMTAGTLICGIIVSMALSLASIIIAAENENDLCQGHDKSGLSLATWLLVSGSVGLCGSVLLMGLVIITAWTGNDAWLAGYVVYTVLTSLFGFAWMIVGIVITARTHGECVADATPLGVMTMIILCLQGVATCFMLQRGSGEM